MICLSGAGQVVLAAGDPAPDPAPFLKIRKTRKFMGLQDVLGVVCAGKALQQAGLTEADLGERAGLFLAVGHIPFEQSDVEPVLKASLEEDAFSLERFAAGGYQRAHPLLTFRCLPNMPAYHVSANFDVQGPYFVTYPGPGQLYQALDEAVCALQRGDIDLALVGGVAHQRNFLVEHHFQRIDAPLPPDNLRDAGGVIVLERQQRLSERGVRSYARLVDHRLSYEPFDVCEPWPRAAEQLHLGGELLAPFGGGALGPASLPAALGYLLGKEPLPSGELHHELQTRDGVVASSRWEIVSP